MDQARITYRGSFTVEASLLMGIILMVLFLIIQMNLFLADSTRMTALAAEDSTYTEQESAEREAWFTQEKRGFFFLKPSSLRHSAGEREIRSEFPLARVALGYGKEVEVSRSFHRKARKPVTFLRLVQAITHGKE